MFRKLRSFAMIPALLALLTASAVQARPLKPQAPTDLLIQVWRLLGPWTSLGTKEGGAMDPNGNKRQGPILPSSAGKGRVSRAPGVR